MVLQTIKKLFTSMFAPGRAVGPGGGQADPGPVPAELSAYFARIADGRFARLHLLDSDAALALTAEMRSHPLVARLGGWILDDPDASDFHVYLTAPALAGSVLYLPHDGEAQVVFASLDAFLDAAQACESGDPPLSDVHPSCAPVAPDQAALARLAASLFDSGSDEDEAVLLAIIPSFDAEQSCLLEALVRSPSFFVAEAAGTLIAARPTPNLWTMATLCARHPHVQAADAGRRALAAIGAPEVLTPYAARTGRQPEFEVAYRFLTEDEGGRSQPPWQHTRWDFMPEQDDPGAADGLCMIWPEFIDADRHTLPAGLVPARGHALMFIVNPDMEASHRARIAVGTRGFFMEGGRRVAECEVVAMDGPGAVPG